MQFLKSKRYDHKKILIQSSSLRSTNHKKIKHRPRSLEEQEEKFGLEDFDLSEEMKTIQKKFTAFDASFKDIDHILKSWDRTTLDVKWTGSPDEALQQEEERESCGLMKT